MNDSKGTTYFSLADYCAMGNSEVSMKEGAAVILKKVGCAGWWFVKVLGNVLTALRFFRIFSATTPDLYSRVCKVAKVFFPLNLCTFQTNSLKFTLILIQHT